MRVIVIAVVLAMPFPGGAQDLPQAPDAAQPPDDAEPVAGRAASGYAPGIDDTEVDAAPPADAYVDFDLFYDSLSPYGEWLWVDPYGWVWAPMVDCAWRPYVFGRWMWTDYGWTWLSYERWGWAPYHYGWWTFAGGPCGWVWVPGYEWGPAWVTWRVGPGYIGWAPLGPRCGLTARRAHRHRDLHLEEQIDELAWVFTRDSDVLAADLRRVAIVPTENPRYLRDSRMAADYDERQERLVNLGPGKAMFERAAGRPVALEPVPHAIAARPVRVKPYAPAARQPSGVPSAPARQGPGGPGPQVAPRSTKARDVPVRVMPPPPAPDPSPGDQPAPGSRRRVEPRVEPPAVAPAPPPQPQQPVPIRRGKGRPVGPRRPF